MISLSLRQIVILGLAVLLSTTAGCSRITIAYNSADFFIERYAKDYLALDDRQVASWQPTLDEILDRHRREDLPYLARFFDTAHKGATKGFDKARMRCLIEQFDGLYRRHLQAAVGLAAPLLAGLTPDQIRALERKFRAEKAEDSSDMDPASAARRDRKRAERYQESIEWWTGSLTDGQKTIIGEQTAAMPDTAGDWLTYRSARRGELISLLNRRASEPQIRRFLEDWLVEHRDLPAGLRKARRRIDDQITGLFIRMDRSFSASQRSHFADRLSTLRGDFMSLQERPRMAFVKCAHSG